MANRVGANVLMDEDYAQEVCLGTFSILISKTCTECVTKFCFQKISYNHFPDLTSLYIIYVFVENKLNCCQKRIASVIYTNRLSLFL